MNRDTHVASPTSGLPPDEFGLLAQLAFASRTGTAHDSHAARHLAFVSPDVLDMDLNDPMQRDFGDYELQEKIGQGGMGMVYRAHQRSLDRDVALKLLAAGPWASRAFIERFRREAQSAARLEHPNIVTVYEAGTQHDLHYFSMRLVRGESLATRLQRDGRLASRVAARLLQVVADAVDYAHRLGVLHLDLKPGNVLIDESGEPLVADFGLARRIDEALAEQGDDVSGTPAYMAPEQATARSQQIGRATDVYGLGAILYEMLTGRPPFLGVTPQQTLERVVSEAVVSPREHVANLSRDLEAICLTCLAKEPAQRYATAADLRDDLRRFLEDRPVGVRQPATIERVRTWVRREPRVAAAAAASVMALLIGLIASISQWQRAESNAGTSRALLWEGRRDAAVQLESSGEGYEALALLRDNLREAEAAGDAIAAAGERRRIGLLRGQGATLIDRIAIDDANPLAAALNDDGSLLAIGFNDLSVRWYDTIGLTERGRVSLAGRGSSSRAVRLPRLLRFASPRRLRVTLDWYDNLTNPTDTDSWLVDLDSSTVIEPPSDFTDFADAAYSPDGRHAVLRDKSMKVQYWQVSPWKPLSPLTTLATEHFTPWILDPRGRYAIRFESALAKLHIYSLPGLNPVDSLTPPHQAGISAWALSRDGDTLALGDFEGRVYLVDMRDRSLRTLPNTRGREVTWLTFSDDDEWIASATYDSIVSVFDVKKGDPVHAGLMGHDYIPRRIGLMRAQRLLIISGEDPTALWRLAKPGERAVPPHRIGLAPAAHERTGFYATTWSASSGLLASAGVDGQVRLWRLPSAPSVPVRAARQAPDRLDFDGRRLVDVAWDSIRLADIRGRGLTDWRQYPQPPGFAVLADAGRILLTTIGPQLRFEDAVTGRPLAPPQELPGSPQRLLATPGGGAVLVSYGAHGEGGFEERLRLFDTHTGAKFGGELAIPGPMRRYAFSSDGSRLLAIGPASGATLVIDTKTLRPIAEFPHDPFEPVQWADFVSDGTVLLALRAPDPRNGTDKLVRWDPVKDEICGEALTPGVMPVGTIAVGETGILAGLYGDYSVGPDGRARELPRLLTREANALLVLDPSQQVLARGLRHEVQLLDAQTLQLLGPPLVADIEALDTLVQLAFAPDGKRLIALSWQGHWLQWSTASWERSVDALSRELATFVTDPDGALMLPSATERRELRAEDPGPWIAPEPRPVMPIGGAAAGGGEPVPPRPSDLPPELIDLSRHYTFGPEALRNFYYNIRPSTRPLPVGRHRIGGVDYDLRGMVGVSKGIDEGRRVVYPPLQGVALGGQHAAAVHMLLDLTLPEPYPTGFLIATVTLHYVDGSRAELPLRTGHELPGYAEDDADVPLVFAANPMMSWSGREDTPFSAPRLTNPHPERALARLDIDVANPQRPLLLLGITLDPLPVIAAPVSSNNP